MRILFFLFFLSCSSNKLSPNINKTHSVSIVVSFIEPYCGGAKPQGSTQLRTNNKPFTNTLFYIEKTKNNKHSKEDMIPLRTNENGNAVLMLTNGRYALYSEDKKLKFSDFLQQNKTVKSGYQNREDACFYNWWIKPDGLFEVSDTTSILSLVVNKRCYTDFNPCIQYIGPLRN